MRVVIADDNLIVRDGLAAILPDVAIVDIRMPPTHTDEGLRAAYEIRAHHPGFGILILSEFVELAIVNRLITQSAEGLGYLLKDRVTELEGLPGDSATRRRRRLRARPGGARPAVLSGRAEEPLDPLTQRERDVLALVAQGRTNRGVAERMVITEGTVQKYVTSIFGKLGLAAGETDHRRVLSVLAYLRR